ncbi:YgjV family protein [Thiospirochaeta perfilievii]|nr:YgjV family protein [Thiospirochaeta perfilievii]
MNYVELIGYLASILVAISLTMSKILRLRIINLIGAATFSVYGFLLGAYPIFFVNSFIVCINIYYLIKMFRNRDVFDILNAKSNREYLNRFYEHYQKDIKHYFPNFVEEDLDKYKSIFILRNMRPVNLVVFNEQSDGIVEILLDYTILEYRDFLNGEYLFSLFKKNETNENQLVTKSNSKEHIKYLKKLGFVKNDGGLYVKKI